MVSKYCKIYFLFLTMLTGTFAYGQSDSVANGSDTVKMTDAILPESAYSLTLPEHTKTIYNIHFSGVIFTLLVLGMVYISYRYWRDNWRKEDAPDTTNNNS